MDLYKSDLIKVNKAFVVIVVNDYTNKIITDESVHLQLCTPCKIVRKADGFNVFLGLGPGSYHLLIGGEMYQERHICVTIPGGSKETTEHTAAVPAEAREQNQSQNVHILRLLPNERYITASVPTVIRGTIGSGDKIRLLCSNQKNPYKLQGDYAAGEKKIRIYHAIDRYMDGKWFGIYNNDLYEEFCIGSALDNKRAYSIRQALAHSYQKQGTSIKRMYTVTANPQGDFFFLVPEESEESGVYEYYLDDEIDIKDLRKGQFQKGKVTTLRGV